MMNKPSTKQTRGVGARPAEVESRQVALWAIQEAMRAVQAELAGRKKALAGWPDPNWHALAGLRSEIERCKAQVDGLAEAKAIIEVWS